MGYRPSGGSAGIDPRRRRPLVAGACLLLFPHTSWGHGFALAWLFHTAFPLHPVFWVAATEALAFWPWARLVATPLLLPPLLRPFQLDALGPGRVKAA